MEHVLPIASMPNTEPVFTVEDKEHKVLLTMILLQLTSKSFRFHVKFHLHLLPPLFVKFKPHET